LASYSARRFFSAGRSKKPPQLRQADFERADVGKGIRGHQTRLHKRNEFLTGKQEGMKYMKLKNLNFPDFLFSC